MVRTGATKQKTTDRGANEDRNRDGLASARMANDAVPDADVSGGNERPGRKFMLLC
jgi:hypothetical protein